MKDYTLISTYWSDDKTKRAEIHKGDEGLSVRLYDHESLQNVRNLNNFSIHYAEDCAENFVMGIGSSKIQLNG
ncbi:hypothetical protein [Shewanella sp.]|jgi:hypothetical protein|uniref:hypothetical protein n=1 Tax=Shewanella sp. TaxID=50422 RepID=UPI0040547219